MSDMSTEDIAGLFKPCVGPLGVHPKLRPLASTYAPDSIELIMLSDQGIVSDGYNHWLMVDREKSVVFIQERGRVRRLAKSLRTVDTPDAEILRLILMYTLKIRQKLTSILTFCRPAEFLAVDTPKMTSKRPFSGTKSGSRPIDTSVSSYEKSSNSHAAVTSGTRKPGRCAPA
ncbi:MAG: hypothetical protein V4625_03185 [Pseudomonadota bacterium]